MNRYQEPAPGDAPDEEEVSSLPDPNADDDQVFAPEFEVPSQSAAGVVAPPAPAATLSARDPAEIERENAQLKQRLEQEATARQQQAVTQVQQWYNSLPDDKKAWAAQQIQAARLQGEAAQREAEDKRRVMWTIAQDRELKDEYLQKFYRRAARMDDPSEMEGLADDYKQMQAGTTGMTKPKPAMASVRPDAGAPQGNRAGSQRKRQEEILAPYMGGGAKQGNLEQLEFELMRHGKYGRIA